MRCDFSFNHYREILTLVKEKGYQSTFYDEQVEGRQIIIRHDIDLDLDAALEMAKIEAELDMKAVYFIWITSPFYNIFENRYKNIIMKIVELGHEIGLHYDETSYMCDSREELISYIDKESNLIKTYFDLDIRTVSFHRPSQYILNSDLKCGKYINTYSKKFFKEFAYISDSRGVWQNGCICDILNNDSPEKLQFLTHAIWWKEKSLINQERLKDFLQFKLEKMSNDLSTNITIYDKKKLILKENSCENYN